jgi:hypothetical protein
MDIDYDEEEQAPFVRLRDGRTKYSKTLNQEQGVSWLLNDELTRKPRKRRAKA